MAITIIGMATRNRKTSSPRRAKISMFATSLLDEWQRLNLPVAEADIVVAVSGGADSSALLLGLDELIKKDRLHLKLIVAHLDHCLRVDSKRDAEWVKKFGKELGYPVVVGKANLKKRKTNLEQAARNARYQFLHKTATKASKFVLTAHTLDDQAETILMRLLRGSAAEGLSGTSALRDIEPGSEVKLVRPLLSWARREDTERYCQLNQIQFRLDEMNEDETFSRVRVRKQLLPLMKSFNNRIVEALGRTATLLGDDAAALAEAARRLLAKADLKAERNRETELPSLNVNILLRAPAAVRRRALREWILQSRGDLRRLEMVHLLAVERLLEGEKGGRVAELPGGMQLTRKRGRLELSTKKRLKKAPTTSKIPRR